MKYRCPKCGKEIEISTQELANLHNSLVCPQCLSTLKVDGDYAYIPLEPNAEDVQPHSHATICPKCGSKILQDKPKFCPECGHDLNGGKTKTDAKHTAQAEPPKPIAESPHLPTEASRQRDVFYDDAVRYIATCNAITTIMLQQYFNISHERAEQLMAQLEEDGIVGSQNNGSPRKILIPHNNSLPFITRRTHRDDPVLMGIDEENNASAPKQGCGCGCWSIVLVILIIYMLIFLF